MKRQTRDAIGRAAAAVEAEGRHVLELLPEAAAAVARAAQTTSDGDAAAHVDRAIALLVAWRELE